MFRSRYRHLVGLVFLSVAHAAVITVSTPSGSRDATGGAVSAQATFTTGNGTLGITLTNLQGDIHDAGQLLSDLQFTVDGVSSGYLLGVSSAQQITVASGGSTTLGVTGSTGWGLGLSGGVADLCEICPGTLTMVSPVTGGPPSQTLIGPGPFTNANSSLLNGHNPFLNQTATFTISNEALTVDSVVTSARFGFGTVAGNYITGGDPRLPAQAPEPETVMLGAAGLLVIGVWRRRARTLRPLVSTAGPHSPAET